MACPDQPYAIGSQQHGQAASRAVPCAPLQLLCAGKNFGQGIDCNLLVKERDTWSSVVFWPGLTPDHLLTLGHPLPNPLN